MIDFVLDLIILIFHYVKISFLEIVIFKPIVVTVASIAKNSFIPSFPKREKSPTKVVEKIGKSNNSPSFYTRSHSFLISKNVQ